MTITVVDAQKLNVTLATGQGPPGPSTLAAQQAAAASQVSANNSAAQAAIATQKAVEAQGFANDAQAVFDDFDTRYLGPFDEPPATDNNGDPLVQGTLYFDNTSNALRAWDSVNLVWTDAAADAAAALLYRNEALAARDLAVASAASADASEAQTLSYRNEALAARDDLQAASPGDSELVPTAGSNPLADARGFIDEGWMLPIQSAAERHARVAARRDQMAGSGFIEFGNPQGGNFSTKAVGVNVGSNTLNDFVYIGRGGALQPNVRTNYPIINAHGIRFVSYQGSVGVNNTAIGPMVKMPPASTTPTLPSFQSLVFAEVFSQAVTGVSGSNRIFPRGFVQNQSGSFSGVILSNANSPASFSAYGKWDVDNGTAVVGFSLAYSTATRQQLLDLLDDPETAETLWWDGDVLVQDLIRFRVVPGLGNNWLITDTTVATSAPRYDNSNYVQTQGQLSEVISDLGNVSNSFNDGGTLDFLDLGVSLCSLTAPSYTAQTFYIPILLWQQGNTGAYHPEFNPAGFGKILNTDDSTAAFWYETDRVITSISDCFTYAVGGDSASGISGHPQGYYNDFRYPDQLVRDLRYNANKVEDSNRLLEKVVRDFQANDYSSIQVKGERPGRLEVVTSTSANITFGGRVFQRSVQNDTYGNLITQRDIGSILIGATGVVARVVAISGTDELRVLKIDGTPWANDAEIQTEFQNVPFLMWKKDTSNINHQAAATMLWCDIIGDPANYPDWLTGKAAGDLAFQGVPNIIDVNTGLRQYPADVTAVGLQKQFRLSKKYISGSTAVVQVIAFDGVNYSNVSAVTVNNQDGTYRIQTLQPENIIKFASTDWVGGGTFDDDTIFFVFYTTEADPTSLASSTELLASSSIRSLSSELINDSTAASFLTGKIPVGGGTIETATLGTKAFVVVNSTNILNASQNIKHEDNILSLVNTPAVKFFPYLSRSSGVAQLKLIYKELKYDTMSSDFGDNQEINVVNSTNTTTDLNGATVATGQVAINTNRIINNAE